jgi:hypothetical protein
MPLASMKDLLLFALRSAQRGDTVGEDPARHDQRLRRSKPACRAQSSPSTDRNVDRLQVICEALETFPSGQRCVAWKG